MKKLRFFLVFSAIALLLLAIEADAVHAAV